MSRLWPGCLVTSYAMLTLSMTVWAIWMHELGHALAARIVGDRLGRRRLTIKPMVNLDPILSLLVPLVTCLASGGYFAVGMGRPFLLTGPSVAICLAGPLVNLVLAAAAWPLGFHHFAVINLVLVAFNLIPTKPTDGWAALNAWKVTRRARRVRLSDTTL